MTAQVPAEARVGDTVTLIARPEDIYLLPPGSAGEDESLSQGTVTKVTFLGNYIDGHVQVHGFDLRVQAPNGTPLTEGEAVPVQLKPASCIGLCE